MAGHAAYYRSQESSKCVTWPSRGRRMPPWLWPPPLLPLLVSLVVVSTLATATTTAATSSSLSHSTPSAAGAVEASSSMPDADAVAAAERGLLQLLGLPRRPSRRVAAGEAAAVPPAMMELYLRGRKGDALPVRGGRARGANTVRSFLQQETTWATPQDGEQRFRLRFDVASIPAKEALAAAELRLSVQRHSNVSHDHPALRILVHEVIRPAKGSSPPILRLLDTRVLASRGSRESKNKKKKLHGKKDRSQEKHAEGNTGKDVRWKENHETSDEDKENESQNEMNDEDDRSSNKEGSRSDHVLIHSKKSTRLKRVLDDEGKEDEIQEGGEVESRRSKREVEDLEELEEENEDESQRKRKLSRREEENDLEEIVVEFDVQPAVQRWREHKGANHGLLVEVLWPSRAQPPASGAMPRLRVRRDTSEPHAQWLRTQPLLLTFTDDGRNTAAPRAQNRDTQHGRGGGGYDEDRNASRGARGRRKRGSGHRFRPTSKDTCRRRDLYVNFADVGWSDWIVAPQGYDAFFCAGECPFPLPAHMNTTNHAVVQTLVHSVQPHAAPRPCCVPTQLSSISLLFLDDNDKVVLKNYQDMAVIGCGCR